MSNQSPQNQAWPGTRTGIWTVALLCLAYLLAFVDRTVINLLVDPIKADLGISDTQFGALQGLAFGLFYTLAALPLGRLTDRFNRRNLLAGGVAVFSVFSICSGLSRSYATMFVSRVGVGLGEANLLPTSYSLLSDTFPPQKLARAISIFTMGAFLGIGLSYIWGGQLIGWFSSIGAVEVPLLGTLAPWQLTFIIMAIPGLLLAPLLMTIREPARHGTRPGGAGIPWRKLFDEFHIRRHVLIPLFLGYALMALSGHASGVWTISVFLRSFEMPPAQIGPIYGLVYMCSAIPGGLFGGWLCDRLTARNMLDAPVRISTFAFLGAGIFGCLAPLMPNPAIALAVFAPGIALQSMMFPLAGTSIQLMLPSHLRGQFSAMYLVVINIIGLGIGPMLIGFLTDSIFADPNDVRYALSIVNGAVAPVGALLLWYALGPYRETRRTFEASL